MSISLLNTVGKLFENIFVFRLVAEINAQGLLSKTLQLAWLVERVKIYFGEKWLTGMVFLGVLKALDLVWIEGLFFKLTIHKMSILH